MALKEDFNPNLTSKSQSHTALGHNAVAAAINDTLDAGLESAPGATATSIAQRIGQILQQIKNITAGTNWYDAVLTFVTTTGTQTLTNKTLDAPKISAAYDSIFIGGNEVLQLGQYDAAAINFPFVQNAPAGDGVGFGAAGDDTNVNLNLLPQGTGQVFIYTSAGTTPALRAEGQDTNLNLLLEPKGSGSVSVDGLLIKSSKLATDNSVITSNITANAVTKGTTVFSVPGVATQTITNGNGMVQVTNATGSLTVTGGDLLVILNLSSYHSAAGALINARVLFDGTADTYWPNGTGYPLFINVANAHFGYTFTGILTGIVAGSYTVSLQMSTGTDSVKNDQNDQFILTIVELKK